MAAVLADIYEAGLLADIKVI